VGKNYWDGGFIPGGECEDGGERGEEGVVDCEGGFGGPDVESYCVAGSGVLVSGSYEGVGDGEIYPG
jgi:hypothetical protein